MHKSSVLSGRSAVLMAAGPSALLVHRGPVLVLLLSLSLYLQEEVSLY